MRIGPAAFTALAIVSILMVCPISADADQEYHKVTFQMPDGTVLGEQQVPHGGYVDLSSLPETPSLEGAEFAGWGDVTKAITEDTVFTASFIYDTKYCVVRYFSEGKALIHTEFVRYGSSATYSEIPEKAPTESHTYVFERWSRDLSVVTSDIDVYPVFKASERMCEVRFFDYDRTLITIREVPYGSSLKDLPDDPVREPTVAYTYEFRSWSVTPNGDSPADLTNIKDTKFVYAFYQPSLAVYDVTFILDGETVAVKRMAYNTKLGIDAALDLFQGSAIALMYRDGDLTEPYQSDRRIIGDTDVHLKLVPGVYSAERDPVTGGVDGTVSVAHTVETANSLRSSGGIYTVCDISQFPYGSSVSMDSGSIGVLRDILGGDALIRIAVPKGSMVIGIDRLEGLISDSDTFSFSISEGPRGVKIASALKNINYTTYCSLSLKVDGRSLTDAGEDILLSLDLSLAEGLDAAAWTITPKGAAIPLDVVYDGSAVSFSTRSIQYFAVGTDTEHVEHLKEKVVMPYGTAEYGKEEDPDLGFIASLSSLEADCGGGILFVPSAFDRAVLRTIEGGAFNRVSDAIAIVIPETVTYFSWLDWSSQVTDIYFMGDRPEFGGDVPSFIRLFVISDRNGWDDLQVIELDEQVYTGAYNKDVFSFTFITVDDSLMVNRYVSGQYVSIPRYISVDGRDREVVYIGDASFMRSSDPAVREAYGLLYETYSLEAVEIPSSITDVMTRAFYGSSLSRFHGSDSVEHVWDEAFKGCGSMASFVMPSSLLYIGPDAFASCSSKSFTRIMIPDSVRFIGKSAFYGCTWLNDLEIGSGVEAVPDSCFAQCSSLSDVSIPGGVLSIGNNAFYNCSSILYIDLMNVRTVGSSAFQCAGRPSMLECVVLGEYIESIGLNAFANCTGIAELEAYCQMPADMDSIFPGMDYSSVIVYASPDVSGSWTVFDNMEVIEDSVPTDDLGRIWRTALGLTLLFAVLGIMAYRFRTRVG